MPIKFEAKKKLVSRSERVKSVELHPELPWVLVALYSGNITIYDFSNQSTVKNFENSSAPVRCAKFCVRKQWIVSGADDLQIRVFNYNTMDKLKAWDAHSDFIRHIVVHPSQPYIISSSDDTTIKIWDMEKNFALHRTLEEHMHYVMMIALNPRDLSTFCSGSLDRTIKVWSLASTTAKANFTLTGHEQGINCVDYFRGDKPYIISGADDRLVKIWDYQTKQCIHTLQGHDNNISAALFHPELPIIMTSAEDGVINIWHSQTFKLETTLNYSLDRVWSIDIGRENSNVIAFGFDEGTVVIKVGSDEPLVSFNNGKVIWTKNLEIQTANLKAISFTQTDSPKDGEVIKVPNVKDLGHSDFYITGIKHSPNGHSFAIYNDKDYAVYKTSAFKSAGFGQGTDLVWSHNNDYAVRDQYLIKAFRNNNQGHFELKTDNLIEQLFGGPLLCAKFFDFLIFYDWETAQIIKKISIQAKKIYWNDNSTQIAIAGADKVYVYEYRSKLVQDKISSGVEFESIEEAFQLSYDVQDKVNSGLWVDNVFCFTNGTGKINYSLAGKVFTLAHADRKKYLLGYSSTQSRLFMIDKFFNITAYDYPLAVAQYQSLAAQGEFQKAAPLLQNIGENYKDKIARFLDSIGQQLIAFQIVLDKEHKFDLAIGLEFIDEAYKIAEESQNPQQFKAVGDIALASGKIKLAISCFEQCEDLGSLLLIFTSLGLKKQLKELAEKAIFLTRLNIAFICYFHIQDLENCHKILVDSERYPEASFFAKTYLPSKISETVALWKKHLEKTNLLSSQKIADPMDYIEEESFADLKHLLKLENYQNEHRKSETFVPAHLYEEYQLALSQDFFAELQGDPSLDLSQYQLVPENLAQENLVLEDHRQKIQNKADEVQ